MKRPRASAKRSEASPKGVKYYRPTFAEIDLDAIRYNLSQFRKIIKKETKILVAVKANAYGHGIVEVSKTLAGSGVDFLGVGTTDEAILLRKKGLETPMLILGAILPSEARAVVKNNISLTLADIRLAYYLNRLASSLRRKAKVHIKIDTGMGRIGIWHEHAISFVKKLAKLKNIALEGIFSHFPSADEDELLTRRQIKDFCALIREIDDLGIDIRYRHMANSIAAIDYKDSHMNLIRPGLMIYGLYPGRDFPVSKIKLKPALSLKSKIVFVKDMPAGRTISYGGTYTTTKRARIATIPIGYGDGLSRQLSNKGHVIVNGRKAPIVGRVCMDQIMSDVTDIPGADVGKDVILIGGQKKSKITMVDIAQICGTIPYEVSCSFDSRIPRIYT